MDETDFRDDKISAEIQTVEGETYNIFVGNYWWMTGAFELQGSRSCTRQAGEAPRDTCDQAATIDLDALPFDDALPSFSSMAGH